MMTRQTLTTFSAGFCLGLLFQFTPLASSSFWEAALPSDLYKRNTRLPYSTPIIERAGYTLSYDGRTKTPLWVYEQLTRDSLKGDAERRNYFPQDPDIPRKIQATSRDYTRAGYDKGHLAPFADHRSSQTEADETFYLSNISPQVPQFNQEYWAKLEQHVRDLTQEYERVEVVTGPLFLPQGLEGQRSVRYAVIGENDVAVPTHFFKVVNVEKGRSKKQWAYILPNKKIDKETALSDFEVTLDRVERAAGIILRDGRGGRRASS